MSSLVGLTTLLCLLCLGRAEYQHPRRSCQVENSLTMLPDRFDPSAYYLCLYGRAEKFYCPAGLKFDQHKPGCVPKRYRVRRADGMKETFPPASSFLLSNLRK